jgi:hypothetical protein
MLRQSRLIRHVVNFESSDKKDRRTSCWYAPLTHTTSSEYVRLQFSHFVLVTIAAWLAVFSSLIIGASFGDVTAVVPPTIGLYMTVVGLAHIAPLYVAFNLRTWDVYDIRINPAITLFEYVAHQAIGFWSCVIEIVAQAIGAVIAGAMVQGIIGNNAAFIAGLGTPVRNTAVGWAFMLQATAALFMGFTYMHNWYHDKSNWMPTTMAYVVAGMSGICFPFLGATTHNPFRYLAACVLENTCNQRGWWVYSIAPFVGVFFGILVTFGDGKGLY